MGTFITSTGARRRTYTEIKADREADFRAALGDGCDLNSTGYLGQFVIAITTGLSEVWSLWQETYDARHPSNAEGVPLNYLLSLIGMERIAAAPTVLNAVCYALGSKVPVNLPSGKEVERLAGSLRFSLSSDITIDSASCRDIYLSRPGTTAGEEVILALSDIGVVSYKVPSSSSDPEWDLLNGMVAMLADADWVGTAVAYDEDDTKPADCQFAGRSLRLSHPTADFAIPTTSWTVELVGSNGVFDCETVGPIDVIAGDVTSIYTPVNDWVSVRNLVDGYTGRYLETDEEARIRRKVAFRTGKSTEEAIYRWITNYVPGIAYCSVVSNRTMEVDQDGRSPKSVEVIVQGGKDIEVANAIWKTAPAGIQVGLDPVNPFSGNTMVQVTDYMGNPQKVYFSRPAPKYLWVEVSYSLYNDEAFALDGLLQIQNAIVNWAGKEYSLGKDVIPSRLLQAVYTVAGLGVCSIRAAVSDSYVIDPVVEYTSNVIPVADRYHIRAATSRIKFVKTN